MMILFPIPHCIFLQQIVEISLKYWIQECVTSKAQKFLIKLVTPFYQKVVGCFVSANTYSGTVFCPPIHHEPKNVTSWLGPCHFKSGTLILNSCKCWTIAFLLQWSISSSCPPIRVSSVYCKIVNSCGRMIDASCLANMAWAMVGPCLKAWARW